MLNFGSFFPAGRCAQSTPTPAMFNTFAMFYPNYVCAVLAVAPAQVLHRLGRHIREARALGSYQLVERLSEGGMGEVWLARHRLLARSAAIKLIRPEMLSDGTREEAAITLGRFEREAQATAALTSPHTIRLFDFGLTGDGTFYYVMELLYGRDLKSLVRNFGPLPPARVMYLIRRVCRSLSEAHAMGLIHRDIRPANIYLCRMGLEYDFAKVLDFGIVKRERRDEATTMVTAEPMVLGTPGYMAPEAILGHADIDRRADVYAVGCVAYFLLTGERVFGAANPIKVSTQHVQEEPMPPSHRAADPAWSRRVRAGLSAQGSEAPARQRRRIVAEGLHLQDSGPVGPAGGSKMVGSASSAPFWEDLEPLLISLSQGIRTARSRRPTTKSRRQSTTCKKRILCSARKSTGRRCLRKSSESRRRCNQC